MIKEFQRVVESMQQSLGCKDRLSHEEANYEFNRNPQTHYYKFGSWKTQHQQV